MLTRQAYFNGQAGEASTSLNYPTLFALTAAYYLCILNLLKARCKLNYSPSSSLSSVFLSLLVLSHLSLPDTCCFIISVISDISYLF